MRPVSSASSAVHRILFGLLAAFGAARFLANGWVEALYLAPDHHLTYAWFPWVRPLPGPLMYAVVASMVRVGRRRRGRVPDPVGGRRRTWPRSSTAS